MGAETESMRALRRVLSFSLLRREQWDRYKYLRGLLILAMVICTLGSGVGWYQLARGVDVRFSGLILLTSAAFAVFFIVPRKLDLIQQTFAGFFVLSVIGTVLRRAPLTLGLEMIAGSAVLLFLFSFFKGKVESKRES